MKRGVGYVVKTFRWCSGVGGVGEYSVEEQEDDLWSLGGVCDGWVGM